jgi:hypothetical protein
MKKHHFAMCALLAAMILGSQTVSAQLPRLPKIDKPKVDKPKGEQPKAESTQATPTAIGENPSPAKQTGGGKSASVKKTEASSTPVLLKDTLEIKTYRFQFWKQRDQGSHWSWVPQVSFHILHDGSSTQRYTAEWLKPDGSLWFSENLRPGSAVGRVQTVFIKSEVPTEEVEKLASITGGAYGVKITNAKSGEVAFQGKFKVSKLAPQFDDPKYKNQFDFYVEEDWLLPVAYVGYDNDENFEAPHPSVWMWFKGDKLKPEDFEARLFYDNRQIASTDENCNNCVKAHEQERGVESCPGREETCHWRLRRFYWKNFVTINEQYDFFKNRVPNTTATNDAPGEYTVKVFYKGQQVREAKFNVAANGAIAPNAFSDKIFLMNHKVLVPAKVTGTAEKWNPATWKTDMFYGNPLAGFNVP